LVSEGLAEINIMGNKIPSNIDKLEEAEELAKSEGRGIWNKSLNIVA
jgi:endonuclease YncB( thermonuclease family)